MDSLQPPESAQSPSYIPTAVAPVGQGQAAVQPPQSSPLSRSSKKKLFLVPIFVLFLVVLAAGAWFLLRSRGESTNSIALLGNDQFSQNVPVAGAPPSLTAGAVITEDTGDVRADSPGFVGGRASETSSATADGCTLDTQECPDGSFVERQGASCEFAACPVGPSSNTPANWTLYRNTKYRYAVSTPNGWVAREDGAQNPAGAQSQFVQIFRSGDEQVEDAFPGIIIEYFGSLPDEQNLESVNHNGISMRQQPGQNGMIYYVPIPQSESEYLIITGADGNTVDAERDEMIRLIFATFQVW